MLERPRHHDSIDMPLKRNGTFKKSEFLKWYEKQEKIEAHPYRHAFKKIMGRTALLTLSASIIAGQINIAYNKNYQANSFVDITPIGEALDPEYADHAVVVMGGYGYRDADFLTEKIGPALQTQFDGQLWSVNYNDASLDASAIAQKIIDTAGEKNVTTVSLIGHSIGGITAAQVAEELSGQSAVQVQALAAMSTPYGYEGLQPWKQDQMNLTGLLDLFPDLVYSTPFQIATETIFRYENYDQGNLTERTVDFINTFTQVWDRVMNRDLPGTWLASDQVLALQNAKLDQQLQSIGDASLDTLRPIVLYISTTGFDSTVNNRFSADSLRENTSAAKLQFIEIPVDGLTHERPWRSAEQLAAALEVASPEIQQKIDENRRLYNIQNTPIFMRVPTR